MLHIMVNACRSGHGGISRQLEDSAAAAGPTEFHQTARREGQQGYLQSCVNHQVPLPILSYKVNHAISRRSAQCSQNSCKK